ncbi:MAG: hypothetical protein A2V90_00635 [Gammaproteobacteria bacterium RBG_16_57_12]|nr:MAG: hypothetical protein A2V90_00635 [Gammaproteobacteria bacterium RBG_16_57_12]
MHDKVKYQYFHCQGLTQLTGPFILDIENHNASPAAPDAAVSAEVNANAAIAAAIAWGDGVRRLADVAVSADLFTISSILK